MPTDGDNFEWLDPAARAEAGARLMRLAETRRLMALFDALIVTATKDGLAVRIEWADGVRSYIELIPIAEAEALFYALLPLFQLRQVPEPSESNSDA